MSERPIIFNSEMVRAVMEGRKVQTRRVLSPRQLKMIDVAASIGECYPLESGHQHPNSQSYYREWCPFGAVGDRLWVRETFQGPLFDAVHLDAYLREPEPFEKPEYCKYAADGGPRPEFFDADDNLRYAWKPSIHMPRWASRITLEITGVRVERLQDISESDARAEGVEPAECAAMDILGGKISFSMLWAEINGFDGSKSWQANPWVWVIEFKRVEGE
jgi:hypothetical protein